jgi:L-alanine-DL-glutamate epimerase-like enolase superfamily enzyme
LHVPIFSLLGGPLTSGRSLPTHYTVGIDDPESVRREVAEATAAGYRDFKLKVGASDPKMDCRRLQAIREECPDARIRVDANGAWDPGEAVQAIERLDAAADGIVFVEQPVAADDPAGLRRVRSAVSPSIMADEDCYSPEDVALLARMDAIDAVNVKIAKAGGIVGAKRVAATAGAHGIPCFVGGMLELDIGAAAAAHFAIATPERTYPTGALNADATDTLLSNHDEWRTDTPTVTVPNAAGLGIDVDPDQIDRYRVD